jgi:hypothetical protein
MIKVSVFPKEIKKEVVEDVGHLTVKYVKSYKTFYRCVEVIDDDLFLLKYITNDGETLFKAIKASNMDDIKTIGDEPTNFFDCLHPADKGYEIISDRWMQEI